MVDWYLTMIFRLSTSPNNGLDGLVQQQGFSQSSRRPSLTNNTASSMITESINDQHSPVSPSWTTSITSTTLGQWLTVCYWTRPIYSGFHHKKGWFPTAKYQFPLTCSIYIWVFPQKSQNHGDFSIGTCQFIPWSTTFRRPVTIAEKPWWPPVPSNDKALLPGTTSVKLRWQNTGRSWGDHGDILGQQDNTREVMNNSISVY